MSVDIRTIIAIAVLATMVAVLIVVLVWRTARRHPESDRVRLSEEMLGLANLTLDYMKDGMTPEAAMRICAMLKPSTGAIAVSITDRDTILAYLGYYGDQPDPTGGPIQTTSTYKTISDGRLRVLRTHDDIGFPASVTKIEAAIIVPLVVGMSTESSSVEGALKFYYEKADEITGLQISVAQGIGRLLSTQMAAIEMEHQRDIATTLELKMLQSQINPHFLFNTINTIASLVRTDPDKARTLLRDFAAFYRSTLENPAELIGLCEEIDQTLRYFAFVVARFGEDRVAIEVNVDEALEDMPVPPFVIQPIIENSVTHGMPSEAKLTIRLDATVSGDDAIIRIADDGVGMDVESFKTMAKEHSGSGLGLALHNVEDRIRGGFGPGSGLTIESELGRGTIVTLTLKGALTGSHPDDGQLDRS